MCKNKTNRETKNKNMLGFGVALREDKAGTQGIRRYLRRVNPPGDDRELGAGQVQQRRGQTVTENSNRRRNTARGTEMGGGGWRVATAGDIRVGGASLREKR